MDLKVFLRLDGSGFQQGLESAKQKAGRFASDLKSDLRGQLAGVFAVGALVQFGRSSLNAALNIAKLRDITGMTAERIQELSYAASQADIDINDIAGAMRKLDVAIMGGRSGSDSFVEAFRVLGVGIGDLKTLTSEGVLMRLAESIGDVGDETAYSAAMMQVMGKSAQEMKAFLREYGTNIQKFRQRGFKMSDADISTLKSAADWGEGSWHDAKAIGGTGQAGGTRGAYGVYKDARFIAEAAWSVFSGLWRNDSTFSERYDEVKQRAIWRNIQMSMMKGNSYFRADTGDVPRSGTRIGPVVNESKSIGDITADERREQELLGDIEKARFKNQLENLGTQQKRAAVQQRINELERQSVEEKFQGNYAKSAELLLESEQLRGELSARAKPDAPFIPSDSMVSVGNFLGRSRAVVEAVGQETNRHLREHTAILRSIESKVGKSNIEVPP